MNNSPYGYIYMIRNIINNKIYFGQTTSDYDFDKRYSGGRWWDISTNDHLKRSAEKYGHDKFEVIRHFDIANTKEQLDELEDLYICMYNTMNPKYGYNKKRGGSYGKHSDESKKKMSEKRKGYKDSDETKKRKSEARKGSKNPQYGKPRTEEEKRKQSEAMKGKLTGSKNGKARKVYQYTKDGNFIKEYETVASAAKDNNVHESGIRACCYGKSKTCGGFVWSYELLNVEVYL